METCAAIGIALTWAIAVASGAMCVTRRAASEAAQFPSNEVTEAFAPHTEEVPAPVAMFVEPESTYDFPVRHRA